MKAAYKAPIRWLLFSHRPSTRIFCAWLKLSPLSRVYTNDIRTNRIRVAMNVTLPNVSVYCTASKRTLLQWRITSADPPNIMFVEFFDKKYLPATDKYIVVIPTRPHCMQVKHLMRNSRLGPNHVDFSNWIAVESGLAISYHGDVWSVWQCVILAMCMFSNYNKACMHTWSLFTGNNYFTVATPAQSVPVSSNHCCGQANIAWWQYSIL